jgi:hypothetical protein
MRILMRRRTMEFLPVNIKVAPGAVEKVKQILSNHEIEGEWEEQDGGRGLLKGVAPINRELPMPVVYAKLSFVRNDLIATGMVLL